MSSFFVSYINGFKGTIKGVFQKKLFTIIFQLICYGVGIILGLVFKPTEFIYDYFLGNAENYYCAVMYADSSVFSLFFDRIVINLGYFAVFFCFGLSPWLSIFSSEIIVYRGYILSVSLSVFSATFGLTGAVVGCFVLLLQNLVVTFTLIVCSSSSLYLVKQCKGKSFFKAYGFTVAVLYFVSLIGAIIELFVAVLLLRPMNFYF